ncbi:MAG: hypothetical protein ACYS0G_06000, partial [Planctomycetota bacterium]
MPGLRSISSVVAALALLAGPAPSPTPPTARDSVVRIIIQVDRHREVKGFVELEDEEVVVVRTLNDEVESFPKSRVLKIVRLVEPEPGQTGTVVLRNGQRRVGVIIEDTFDHVLIEIEGIRAKLVRDLVDFVVLDPTFEERYARFKAALRTHLPEQHLDLCRWLLEHRSYEAAQRELRELLEYKSLPEAHRLLTIVEAQLALREKPAPTRPPRKESDAGGGAQDADEVQPNDRQHPL